MCQKSSAGKRHQFNDNDSLVNDLIDRIDGYSSESIIQNNGFFTECYKNFTNSIQIKRAEKRFRSALEQSSPSIIKPKVGRLSLSVSSIENEEGTILRSGTTPFDKDSCRLPTVLSLRCPVDCCIISQIPGG